MTKIDVLELQRMLAILEGNWRRERELADIIAWERAQSIDLVHELWPDSVVLNSYGERYHE